LRRAGVQSEVIGADDQSAQPTRWRGSISQEACQYPAWP
jgi:hypothetical protein